MSEVTPVDGIYDRIVVLFPLMPKIHGLKSGRKKRFSNREQSGVFFGGCSGHRGWVLSIHSFVIYFACPGTSQFSLDGEDGECLEPHIASHKAGEWMHIHAHQSQNDLGMMELKIFINGEREGKITNTIASAANNLKVIMVVTPRTPRAGKIRNMYFGKFPLWEF